VADQTNEKSADLAPNWGFATTSTTNNKIKREVVMTKYATKAKKTVATAVHKMKEGKLLFGKSRKKVADIKQAVAIGLSEARKKGAKVLKKKTS
jgi:hypothetical protein